MINLGDEVMDTVSGYKGIAIARHDYLNGCTRFSVQPKIDKDGKLPPGEAFDEPQLKVTKALKIVVEAMSQPVRRTGGPTKYMPKPRPV